jgi:hypothetical protein
MKIKTFFLVAIAIGLVILNQSIFSNKVSRITDQIKENNAYFINTFTLEHMSESVSKQYLSHKYGLDITDVRVFNQGSTSTVELTVLNAGMFNTKKVILKDLPSNTYQLLRVQEYATEKIKEMPKDADVNAYVNNLNTEMRNKFSMSTNCNPDIRVEKTKSGYSYELTLNFKYPVYGGSDFNEHVYLNID